MKVKNEFVLKDCMGASLAIRIRVTKRFRIRLWIAEKLFKLAGKVMNCKTEVELCTVAPPRCTIGVFKAGETLYPGQAVYFDDESGQVMSIKR